MLIEFLSLKHFNVNYSIITIRLYWKEIKLVQMKFQSFCKMNRRMACDFTSFSNDSVISGRWSGDNERLRASEPRLRLKRSPPWAGLETEIARSVGQRLTY